MGAVEGRELGARLKNIVLIIGAMKSGTTTLYADLAHHPEIASSPQKELLFFSSDERFARGADWYNSSYHIEAQHKWLIDGTTDCAKYPYCGDVPARLHAYGANAKIIYMMRHPVRRMESHARHVARARAEVNEVRSDRHEGHSLEFGPSDVSRAVSNYAMQIDQFRPWFDRGDMLLVNTEEYDQQREEVIKRIIEFLGLEPMVGLPPSQRFNRGDAFIRRTKLGYIRNIPVLGPFLKAVLPESMRKKAWEKDVLPGRFHFTQEEETKLVQEMRGSLDRLRDEYGVDIARWWNL